VTSFRVPRDSTKAAASNPEKQTYCCWSGGDFTKESTRLSCDGKTENR
jgi:hypothetical protein